MEDVGTARKLRLRFSVIQILAWASMATATYLTVWLKDYGCDSAQIGLVTSIGALLGAASLPLWGILGDRALSSKKTFLLCSCLFAAAILPLTQFGVRWPFLFVAVFTVLARCFNVPENSLLDGWCVETLAPAKVSYGSIRLWGSIGFSAASILMTALYGRFGVNRLFLLLIPLQGLLLLVSFRVPSARHTDAAPGKQEVAGRGELRELMKNRDFLLLLTVSVALFMYLSVTMVFSAYVFDSAAVRIEYLGLFSGLRALAEVVSMTVAMRVKGEKKMFLLLCIAGGLTIAEHVWYGLAEGFVSLLLAYLLSGFAGGLVYGTLPELVYAKVPHPVANTAQAVLGAVRTVLTVIGSLAAGGAIDAIGVRSVMLIVAAIQTVFVAFYMISFTRMSRSGGNAAA